MNGERTILERNLQRLFQKSFVPVTPTASFRASLSSTLERELEELAGESSAAPRPRVTRTSWSRPARLAAAAIVVLALAASLWLVLGRRAFGKSLDELLASGAVALRERFDEEWSAIDGEELARGFEAGVRAFEMATPIGRSARLWFGSEGRLDLAPESRVSIASTNDARAFTLERGGFALERYAEGAAWTIGGAEATVAIERGALSARIDDASAHGGTGACLIVRLERGTAFALQSSGARIALEPGVELALQGDRVLLASVGSDDPVPLADERRSVAATTDEERTQPAEHVAREVARIAGTLRVPARSTSPARYTVTLLRRESLPGVSRPRTRTFESTAAFAYEGLQPGTYEVIVEAPGFGVWRAQDIDAPAGAAVALDVALVPGARLFGRVVDLETGLGIEGASVISEDDVPAQVIPLTLDETTPSWQARATTGPDGVFALEGLSAGPWILRASHAGHGATWVGPIAPDSARVREGVEVKLARAGKIAGRVAHEDGATWKGAVIIACPMGSTYRLTRMSYGVGITDADGHYEIGDLPSGSYIVFNVLAGQSTAQASSFTETEVESGKTARVDLPRHAGGTLASGRLFDHAGAPLENYDVTLQPIGTRDASGWRSSRSGPDGSFKFDGMAPGRYEVYVGTGLGVRFALASEIEVPSTPEFQFEIRLEEGVIRGRARAGSDGTPIARSFLMLEVQRTDGFQFAGKGLTADDGSFAFDHLAPGTYRVSVYPEQRGLAPAISADLWIAATTREIECELRAERGASLRVVVLDARGAPAAGVALRFVDAHGVATEFTADDRTDATGALNVPGLAAGRWTVTASRALPTTIDLTVGEERELVLRQEP
jgi:hypothetical protein